MKKSTQVETEKKFNACNSRGQVVAEFVFCFVLVMLLFWGCILVIRWAGVSMAQRRIAHDSVLTTGVNDEWKYLPDSPLRQVNPDFHDGKKMNLIFDDR